MPIDQIIVFFNEYLLIDSLRLWIPRLAPMHIIKAKPIEMALYIS